MAAKVTVKRIGPGYYEVSTPQGTYRVENISHRGSGYGLGPNWMIISPGEEVADASKPTKREAIEYIQVICDDDEREAARTPEDVELPSDEADREQAQSETTSQVPGTLVDPWTWIRRSSK